jgi:cyclopropane-fatty-acyl-phospholipid synthase
MDGWWETPNLQTLLDVIVLNNEHIEHDYHGAALLRTYERLRHWLRSNTRRGARRNIAHHYDLGNDFYRFWLDDTMTYSSALFSRQGESLAQAQQNKYAAICDRIELRPGDHVLEIGCGWGGFAEYAITQRKARVTGLTLSRAQRDFARKRLFEAGLAEHSEIVLRDYRDERGLYDAIASIEMFEAVGEKYWPAYFDTLRARLKPGRVAALQVITIADRWFNQYRSRADFIQKYIFPGGMLPSPSALHREAALAGFDIQGATEFGDSYSQTLREWREAFNARWSEIARLSFDARFNRMWNFYLAACAACFSAGTTNVMQISLRQRS